MNTLNRQTFQDWHISYNPYTDILQLFDQSAMSKDKNDLKETQLRNASVYTDKNNNLHIIIFSGAYDKIGDVDNMDRKHIIDKVREMVGNYGTTKTAKTN